MSNHTRLVLAKKISAWSILLIVWTACQPTSDKSINQSDEILIGTLRRVSQVPYVFEPHIAVNPMNSNHIAAVVISIPEFECALDLQCRGKLLLYTSKDSGVTWVEQIPFERSEISGDGVVAFGPDGMLYLTGLGSNTVMTVRADTEGKMTLSNTSLIATGQTDKPWLTIEPQDGTLYVTYNGATEDKNDAVLLSKSIDKGQTWDEPVIVDAGVSISALESGQANPQFGAQVMLGRGDNLAVAWAWAPGFDTLPKGVWVATSNDRGQTFSKARQIAETWGIISTAFHGSDYYIFYRKGTEQSQELVVAIFRDEGQTWTTSSVSGELPLYFDVDKAPGVNVAPNGTIDVVFYAHGVGAPGCIDIAAFLNRWKQGWIDQCVYDVYYTFSKDDGQTFHAPIKLNDTPIVGARFVQTRGISRPGEYMGMASTGKYAYPIWIDTQGTEGTQAYTVQINR